MALLCLLIKYLYRIQLFIYDLLAVIPYIHISSEAMTVELTHHQKTKSLTKSLFIYIALFPISQRRSSFDISQQHYYDSI